MLKSTLLLFSENNSLPLYPSLQKYPLLSASQLRPRLQAAPTLGLSIRWLVPIVIDKTVYNPINQAVGHARRHSDSICYCVCGKVTPATHRILILISF